MSSKFAQWYSNPKNRKKLNDRRRERYRTDPEYRKRVLEGTRDWRSKHQGDRSHRPKLPKILFTIGEVAERLNVEQKTLRTLEKVKLIPKTAKKGHHRRFTRRQIELVSAIVEHRKSVHYTDPKYHQVLNKLSKQAFAKWGH